MKLHQPTNVVSGHPRPDIGSPVHSRAQSFQPRAALVFLLVSLTLVLSGGVVLGDGCTQDWAPGLFPADQLHGAVRVLLAHDDGTGPALYAGGGFTNAGGVTANYIGRWRNGAWQALGSGMNGYVNAVCVYDDGTGPALCAGGEFATAGGVTANYIARWKNGAWQALGSGMNGAVNAMCVYDDGTGPALYAGGGFTSAGGVAASYIARWRNGAWQALGSGMGGTYLNVYSLCVYDDGTGPALYAGGYFTTAGGVTANNIARWKDGAWQSVGSGMGSTVTAFCMHDDGTGPALYAGGGFTTAGGVVANHIARWKNGAWQALGTGMGGTYPYFVNALCVYDDGTGPALYAGGSFTSAGGIVAKRVARWSNGAWQALGGGMDYTVRALCVYDDGVGPALYAAAGFTTADGVGTEFIARWKSSAWQALGTGVGGACSSVLDLLVYDDGTGSALYAGGEFTTAGSVAGTSCIARWKDGAWHALGTGVSDFVNALCVYDDGTGSALYVGGLFTKAGGVTANRIARWKDGAWHALGSGMGSSSSYPQTFALCVYDDGTGPALYAGGYFTTAGGVWAYNIARWKNGAWQALGNGMGGGSNPHVFALYVYDDGTGPALYAGGSFTSADGVAANHIARFENGAWQALGNGVDPAYSSVYALCMYDDGTGPALYVGGSFTTAGGLPANYIARWKDGAWQPVGSGMSLFGYVKTLYVYDDGTGPALYAGGNFTSAGGVAASYIARWKNSTWQVLGSGMNDGVESLCGYDDGTGPALYAGGWFTTAGGHPSGYMAKWGCAPTMVTAVGQAKALPDNSGVQICGLPVTRSFGGMFYIEDAYRAAGIRVNPVSGDWPAEGATPSVAGLIKTVDGERLIQGDVTPGGSGTMPSSLWMNLDAAYARLTQGLLVVVSGRASVPSSGNVFTIDDGSPSGTMRVELYGVSLPANQSYVLATGALGADTEGPIVRVNKPGDLVVVSE